MELGLHKDRGKLWPGTRLSKVPTLFGWHNSLCIFKAKASRGTKLCIYFNFYSLYNIWKDQLYRISRSQFEEWHLGPGWFSGLWRNGPQGGNWTHDLRVWSPLLHRLRNKVRQEQVLGDENVDWTAMNMYKYNWGRVTFITNVGRVAQLEQIELYEFRKYCPQ